MKIIIDQLCHKLHYLSNDASYRKIKYLQMMKYVTYICKKLKEYNAIKDVFDKNEDG